MLFTRMQGQWIKFQTYNIIRSIFSTYNTLQNLIIVIIIFFLASIIKQYHYLKHSKLSN